jgi:hypothetical protein
LPSGSASFKVLGCNSKLLNVENINWDFLEAKLITKLDARVCELASSGARLTLLDSCISGIPSYYMQCFCSTKPLLVRWTTIGGDFFGLGKRRKNSIAW